MVSNFRSFLRNLPVNTDLMREFLAEHLFDAQDTVDWSADEPVLAAALADAIEAHTDTAVRDDLIAALEQVAQLADGPGTRQMLTVCGSDPEIAAAFQSLESPEERALWLYVHAPGKFNEAVVARLFDDGLTRDSSQRWTLPARPDLQLEEAVQNTIAAAVAGFYLKRFGYGRNYKPYVVPRHLEGAILFVIDLADHACNRAVWVDGHLRRGPLILSRTLVLNYQLATGRTETVAPGGADAHKVLVEAFSPSTGSRRREPPSASRARPTGSMRCGMAWTSSTAKRSVSSSPGSRASPRCIWKPACAARMKSWGGATGPPWRSCSMWSTRLTTP